MATENRTVSAKQNLSGWQKLKTWFTAIASAMDYDPQFQTQLAITQLRNETAKLRMRITELEKRDI